MGGGFSLSIRGRSGLFAGGWPLVKANRAEISLSAWRGWELEKALSGPFHSRVRGHRVRGRWCRGARRHDFLESERHFLKRRDAIFNFYGPLSSLFSF